MTFPPTLPSPAAAPADTLSPPPSPTPDPTRRELLAAASLGALGTCLPGDKAAASIAAAAPAGHAPKVLRYALRIAETGFDPARVADLYSRYVTGHVYEGLYGYDHLARPPKLIPLLARELPEHNADHTQWTLRLKEGVHFAPHPVFKGRQREVVAQDMVYALLRFVDPASNSPSVSEIEELGILGLMEHRDAMIKAQKPFDYDHPIEGLRALDRYTLQIRVKHPRPRLPDVLAQGDLYGPVAREVVEFHGGNLMDAPHGSGPFQLKEWRRSSLIVLEQNPHYRERVYDAEPAPDDAEGQALLARFKGRRIPMVDRVELAIIEENQPRWLSFLNRQFDLIFQLPEDFVNQALPNGQLAPNLAKEGIQAWRTLNADVLFTVFNMDDPVVGGLAPERVALRRAIGLGTDVQREINLARRRQGLVAQSYQLPHTYSFDAQFKSSMGEFDPARAKALLDLYGYKDVDGDGWRENPDGSKLELESLTTPDAFQRQIDEIWAKAMTAIGLRIRFKSAKWPENFKALRGGRFQIWSLATSASKPDAQDALTLLDSRHIGSSNYARFRFPPLDALADRANEMPNGPERLAVFREASRIAAAYMPYKFRAHRFFTDMAHRHLIGYRRPAVWQNWWEYVDIDTSALPSA